MIAGGDKLLFLCGCLQPGRDGVGDYTRRLAGELSRLGHECRLIALNDSFVDCIHGDQMPLDQDGVRVLRLPRAVSWKRRIHVARDWIGGFNPDWISLQFVPYSFHPKGLPFGLGRKLKQLAPMANWHVMFHELWIGMECGARWHQRIVGEVQKWLVRGVLSQLRPSKISTQAAPYLQQLALLGYPAAHLPLFGNIPPLRVGRSQRRVDSGVELVVFGGVHRGSPAVEFARDCATFCKASGRRIRLTLAGRCGSEQVVWEEAWRAAGLEVHVMGEGAPQEISKVLQSASFGVSTTPLALIEKSGSVAAMLEHLLPVLSVAPQWSARGISGHRPPAGVFEYKQFQLAETLDAAGSAEIRGTGVADVAVQFIVALGQ